MQSLNAKFSADFSELEKGADRAEVHIQVIEKATKRAAAEIGKMAGAFRGDALIKDATLAAKAVEAIGGVTKITTEDQKKLTASVEGALDAYRRMGTDPPASLKKISSELTVIAEKHRAVEAEAKKLAEAEKKAAAEVEKANQQFGENLRSAGQGLTSAGTALTATISAPIIAGFALSVKAAKDFQSAYANVVKTVDGFDVDAFGNLNKDAKAFSLEIRQLAKDIPATANELSNIAAIGGQFGVSRGGLLEFTESVAKLGVAVDGISAEEAAASLAQISKIAKVAEGEIDNLSSALVELGNNGTSTEGTILEMSKRFAGAGAAAGLTGAEILGVSAAVANLGIEAEAGGSAISKTFGEIGAAVARGGDDIKAFATIARVSSDEFARVWKQSAVQGFDLFLKGLRDAQAEGKNMTVILEGLGIKEMRQASAIRSLALDYDNFSKTVAQSTEAFEKNTALSEEARKKYATFDNQLQLFQNRLTDVGIELGGPLLTAMRSMLDAADPVLDTIADLAKSFAELPKEAQLAVGAIAGAAGLGPVLLIFTGQALEATASILDFTKALRGIRTANAAADIAAVGGATATLGTNASRVLPLLGRAGLVGGIAAVGTASVVAAAEVESRWSKALVGSLNPLSGLIVSLRDARDGWQKLAADLGKGDAGAASKMFAGLRDGAGEAKKVMADLGVVASDVRDRARDTAAVFGKEWLTQTKNVAAAIADSLTPGLKEAVEWLGKVAEATPAFRDLYRGAKLVADVIGLDLKQSLADAAMTASVSLIPGLTGVAGQVPSVEAWRKWREELAVAADIVRELEAMQVRMAKRPPPKMFQSDMSSFRAAFDRDFARMMEDTIGETALRAQGKVQQSLEETAKLAKQYADDIARVGRDAFKKAAADKQTYNLSLKEAATLHGIAETSLARYMNEMKGVPRAAKAAKDALGGIDFKGDQDKAIKTAQRLGEQVEKLGGVSRLTKEQQEALNKAMHAGDAAMRAQGRAGEPLAGTFRRLASETEDWAKAIKLATGGLDDMLAAARKVDNRTLLDIQFGDLGRELSKLHLGIGDVGRAALNADQAYEKFAGTGKKNTVDLGNAIDDLARAWAQLAQIRPLEGWIQDVAELIQLMNIGSQVGDQFREMFAKRDKETGKIIEGKGAGFDFSSLTGKQGSGAAIAGYMNLFQTGVNAWGAMDQATDVQGRGNRALKGAATGASIGGSIVPGWGHVVGAIVGALIGALRNPGFEDVMKRVAHNFGVNISEELARAIDKQKKAFGDSRQAAEIFNLDKIIQQGGGIKDSNVKQLSDALRAAFSMVETGKFTVADAREVLDKNFATFAAHVEKSKSLASKSFTELFELNKRFGTNSEQMRDFVDRQTSVLGGGVAALAAPLMEQYGGLGDQIDGARKEVDRLNAGGRQGTEEYARAVEILNSLQAKQKEGAAASAKEFERLGIIALGAFNAAINAGGDLVGAVEKMGPGLDTLLGIQKDLGLETSNPALGELMGFRNLVNDNKTLVMSAGALGETLRAVTSIGGLTTDMLTAMEGQGVETFDRLVKAGFSENQALSTMKDFLFNVKEAHERLGTPIDANTQRLIDQAQEMGLLKDDGKDMTAVMKQGFEKVTDAIMKVVDKLSGDLPKAAEDAKKAIERIPKKVPVEIEVAYRNPEAFEGGRIVRPSMDPPPSEPDGTSRPQTERPSFAAGGWGNFGSGTLAMLHGREAIFTEPQLRGLAGVIQQQNERMSGEATSVHVEFNGDMIVHGNADANIAEKIADSLAMKIMQGGRTKTLWKEAMR